MLGWVTTPVCACCRWGPAAACGWRWTSAGVRLARRAERGSAGFLLFVAGRRGAWSREEGVVRLLTSESLACSLACSLQGTGASACSLHPQPQPAATVGRWPCWGVGTGAAPSRAAITASHRRPGYP